MAAGDHLAGSQIYVDKLIVIFRVDRLRGIRRAADVNGSPLHVEGPSESNDLCEGVDTVLGAEARVGVVLGCLDGRVLGSEQVLSNLVDDEVERVGIVKRVVGDKAGVGSETRIRLVVGDVPGRGRRLFGLYLGGTAH